MNTAALRSTLVTAWASLVVAGVIGLYFQARVRVGRGVTIAELATASGVVQFRSRDIPLWSYAVTDQLFYDHDVLATGAAAKARVRFTDGRTLELGPETHVLLSKAKGGDSEDFVVHLLSGTLAAKAPDAGQPAARHGLIVRVGDEELVAGAGGAALRVDHRQGEPVRVEVTAGKVDRHGAYGAADEVLTAKTPAPAAAAPAPAPFVPVLAARAMTVLSAKLDQPRLGSAPPPLLAAPAADPAVIAAAAAKAQAAAKALAASAAAAKAKEKARLLALREAAAPGTAPKLVYPLPGARLWTRFAFTGGAPDLAVTLSKPYGDESMDETVYVTRLEGSASAGNATVAASDGAGQDQQHLRVSGAQVAKFAAPWSDHGLTLGRLTLRPGARRGGVQVFAAAPRALVVGSLAGQPARPLTVRLRALVPQPPASDWLFESPSLTGSEADVAVHLVSGTALPALGGLLAGAGQFTIAAAAVPEHADAFAVRGGYVTAALDLKSPTPARWQTLRQALDADFIFIGPKAALVQGFTRTAPDHGKLIAERLAQEDVFVLRGGELIRLESRLMKENPAAAKLVEDTAVALFTEKVSIVGSR